MAAGGCREPKVFSAEVVEKSCVSMLIFRVPVLPGRNPTVPHYRKPSVHVEKIIFYSGYQISWPEILA
jgi:hypothetical protein